jgi:site-specific DNA-methyltransferase (adenine-specific)
MEKTLKVNEIYLGDNLELLKQLEDNSIDSCVSDFPYNLGFMGKKWDTIGNYYQWCNDRAIELFRVLKPGAFCLIFSGTRTQHRMVCGFEDAGFEIKDQIDWIYSQGFPKNYNISKGFDKKAGAKREIIGRSNRAIGKNPVATSFAGTSTFSETADGRENSKWITAPATDLAKQWDGWGTALKPTHEPIMMAQKPIEKNYCYNVQKWGVGGLYIDGSRIELNGEVVPINKLEKWSGFGEENRPDYEATVNTKGRYPANTIFDEDAGEMLNEQSGKRHSSGIYNNQSDSHANMYGMNANRANIQYSDSGGASRFFYCAKASQKDRTENGQIENSHPTVKPTLLMTHLIKLVTPPNGINIDICEGTGTSMKACLWLKKDGYEVNHIGFESDPDSYETALKRKELNTIK